jgi:hypothetical protein
MVGDRFGNEVKQPRGESVSDLLPRGSPSQCTVKETESNENLSGHGNQTNPEIAVTGRYSGTARIAKRYRFAGLAVFALPPSKVKNTRGPTPRKRILEVKK